MKIMILNPLFPKDKAKAKEISKPQFDVVHDYIVGELNKGKAPKDAVIVKMLEDAGCPLVFDDCAT